VSEETGVLSNEERAQAALGTKDKAQKLKDKAQQLNDKAQQLKDKASQAIWISEIFEGILFNFNS
jgi:X-X-X-Leu-X-X-Gly heptad repeat protein